MLTYLISDPQGQYGENLVGQFIFSENMELVDDQVLSMQGLVI